MEYFKQLVGPTFDEDQFPFVPEGQAVDMGQDSDGRPLFDPRILDSAEFFRNPYPYYRILRDHYPVFHDTLHNCYWVTRYDDISECYFDDEGFNRIGDDETNVAVSYTQLRAPETTLQLV